MNILGINIQTKKSLAAALAKAAAPVPVDTDDRPESVKFGQAHNKGSARQMLDTLAQNAKDADRNSKIALYVSIPHQAFFMLSMVHLQFGGGVYAIAETVIAIAICFVVPYLVDRAILMNIRTLGTRAASDWSKIRAGAVLGIALPWSMYVNFSAPGEPIIRYAAAGLVALVALYQISKLVVPSFAKMGEYELAAKAELARIELADAAASGTPVASPKTSRVELQRRKDAALAFAKANPNVTVSQLVKLHNITRDAAKKILVGLGSVRVPQAPAAAPVSPAPAGMNISHTYQQM